MDPVKDFLARNGYGQAPSRPAAPGPPDPAAWLAKQPPQDFNVQPENEGTLLDTGITFGLRVVPAVAGGALAGFLGLPSGPGAIGAGLVGGAAGAGLGETAAEAYEKSRGLREELNPTQIATQTALGAIPLGKQAAGVKGILQGAGKGAVLGGGSVAATELAEGQTPTLKSVGLGAGLGAFLGGGTSAAMQRLQRIKAERAAAELEQEAEKFTPVHSASDTRLADLLRGRGPVEAAPEFTRASGGEQMTPVGVRRPGYVEDSIIGRAAREEPDTIQPATPGDPRVERAMPATVRPRGSFRQYLMSDADVQAELAAERNASQAAQDANWEAQKAVGPEVRPDLGAALDAAAAKAERASAAQAAEAAAAAEADRVARAAAEAEVGAAVGGAEQVARRDELARMLRVGSPEDVAEREAARVAALVPEPTGDTRGGGALPRTVPAENTALAGMLKGEVAAASRYDRLKRALGFGNAKPEPALGPVPVSAGKPFPIGVEDRATLGEVRQLMGDEPPSFLHGDTPLSPFYDAVRARGNPKWTNSDIRKGIDRLLEGRENIYGRAALDVARERFPARGAPWQHGLAGAARQPGVRGSFLKYVDADQGIQEGVAREAERERSAFERFMAPDDGPGGGLDPKLVGKTQVGPSYQTRKAAEDAAAALRAQGRQAEAVSYDRNAHVVLEPRPKAAAPPVSAGREPGQEGFGRARLITTLGGASVGGAAGATQGETPGERAKNAAIGALLGVGGAAAMGKMAGRLRRQATTELEHVLGSETQKAPKATTERATFGLSEAAREMARKELPSAVDIPPERLVEITRLRKQFGDQADDLARVMREPMDGEPGFAEQRRHRIPNARRDALARLEEVDAMKPGAIGKLLNAEQTIAHKDALTTLTARVIEKAKALKDTGIDVNNLPAVENLSDSQIMQLLDWQETRQWQETIFKTLWGSAAEQGRALAANKVMARVRPGEIQVIRDVMRKGRFGEDVLKAARIWGNLDVNDPVAVFKAMKDVQQRGAWDKITGYWMSNILSGIKTQERNLLGNLTRFATNTVMKGTAAAPLDLLKATLTGKPRQFYAREAIEDLSGALHSTGKAWADFWYTLKNGFSKEYLETALELEGGFAPRPEFGRLLGMGTEATNPFNWPGRFLDAMDRAFYQLNSGAETYSQAYTRALNEAKRQNLAGQAKTDFIAKRSFDLRSKPDLELTKSVHQASLEATYRENEGKFGQLIQQMRREIPAMTMAMPFIKTVSNLARQGYEVTPVSGVVKLGKQLLGNERAWNRVGGEREATMMQAKALFGTAASAFFGYLAASGRLSGSGPSDRATRAQLMASGWRPNSVKLDLPDAIAAGLGASKSDDGQYWVNYSLFQPLALSMSLVANSLEAWKEQQGKAVKSNRVIDASEIGVQTAAKIAKSALNQSYLQGLFSLVDAINNGQMSAGKFAEQIAQGFVPFAGMNRNITQAVDPVIRDPRGIPESLMANTPGLSTRVSPRLGRYGEPIERTGSPLRRFLGVPEVEPTTNDWIDKELNRLGVSLGTPTDRLTLPEWVKGDRKITEEQSVRLREARGRATRAALAQLMGSPGYARMPEWAKTRMARKAIQRGTYMAANAARISFATGRPELLSRMMAPIYRRAEASYDPKQRKGM